MYLLLFAIWVVLNGRVTAEIILIGLLIAGLIYAFICNFMDFSYQKDVFIMRRTGYIIKYIIVLFIEIIKANLNVIKLVFSTKYENEPALIKFKVDLKTKGARVLLANAITLTPGTITVSLDDNEYTVHCLDKDFGKGIESSVFVELLKKMEAPIVKK